MECNRGEAVRAKEIAEKKFAANDLSGAKKFAMKANSLFPGLEGILNMISTIDVYISAAERKINGETDWYGVLGVHPRADDETIRRSYKDLALQLHPDKNTFVGANRAFQFVLEARRILLNKESRSIYDLKRRRGIISPRKVPPSSSSSNVPAAEEKENVFKTKKSNVPAPPPPPPPSSTMKKNLFWTVCHHCLMQHQYFRIYLHHSYKCPNCNEYFLAIETTAPSSSSKVANQNEQHPYHHQASTSTCESNDDQWVPVFGPAAGLSTSDEAVVAMVDNANEQVRIRREEAEAATARKKKKTESELPDAKRRKGGDI